MSSFQQPIRPNPGVSVGRMGIAGLNAPGIAAAGPNQDRTIDDLLGALVVGGNTAARIGNQFDRSRIEKEREAAKIESQYAGDAFRHFKSRWPEWQQQIDEGKMQLPGEGTIAERVEAFVSQTLPEDTPEPYREAFRQIAEPHMAAAFAARQTRLQEAARQEAAQVIAERVIVDPSSAGKAMEEARALFPDATDTQLLDMVVMPSVRNAAATGNPDQFDRAAAGLGDRFPGVQAQLRQQMEARHQVAAARDEREALEAVENLVASHLLPDTYNPEAARDVVAQASIGNADRDRLLQAIDRRERGATAALEAQIGQQVQQIAAENPEPAAFRQQVLAIAAENPDILDNARVQEITDGYTRQAIRNAASDGNVSRVGSLAGLLSGDEGDQQFAREQAMVALSVVRDNRTSAIESGVMAGLMTPDRALQIAQDGLVAFNRNHDDPAGLDPDHARRIVSAAGGREKADTARSAVVARLNGQTGLPLNPTMHGKAFDEVIGPEGMGLIDDTGRITDAAALSTAIGRANFTTPMVREAITANLLAEDGEGYMNAVRVVRDVRNQDNRAWADLFNADTGGVIGDAINQIDIETRRGTLNGEGDPLAMQRIRDAMNRERMTTEERNDQIANINRHTGEKVADIVDELAEDSVGMYDYAQDTIGEAIAAALPTGPGDVLQSVTPAGVFGPIFGMDTQFGRGMAGLLDVPDPSIDGLDSSAYEELRDTLINEYAQLSRSGRPEQALKLAKERAKLMIQADYDLVRMNGRVYFTRIAGQTGRLPDEMRWSAATEAEAKSELAEAIKAGRVKGVSAGQITRMVPTFDGANPEQWGWLYHIDGVPVTYDGTNTPVLYQPSDPAKVQAAQFRELMDRKRKEGATPGLKDRTLQQEPDITKTLGRFYY